MVTTVNIASCMCSVNNIPYCYCKISSFKTITVAQYTRSVSLVYNAVIVYVCHVISARVCICIYNAECRQTKTVLDILTCTYRIARLTLYSALYTFVYTTLNTSSHSIQHPQSISYLLYQ